MEFRLQVFYTVAKELSFKKAADILFISQPAITKHIHELENKYQTALFERSGNRKVKLTKAGTILLQHVQALNNAYQEMDFALNDLTNKYSGTLKIGASSTISQYILPKLLARFHKNFPDLKVQLSTGNTSDIENYLINNQIDIGIVEGKNNNQSFHYEDFIKDELVLVCKFSHPLNKEKNIKTIHLLQFPWLLREQGSGTLNVFTEALNKAQIKLSELNIEMTLGSTESIKSYLQESNCLAFISINAISNELKNNELQFMEVNDFSICRMFRFIENHGNNNTNAALFKNFLIQQKNSFQ